MSEVPAFQSELEHDMRFELPHFSEDSPASLFLMTPERVTDDYVSWLNSSEINQYLESRFVVHTVESTRTFVSAMMASCDCLFLGVHSNVLDRHVGNIKLGPIDRHHRIAEIGILIGDRCAWGRGVATYAINMISDIAKSHLNLRKLTAGCYATNQGSLGAFKKAGFVVEGIRPSQLLLNDEPEDLVLMGRLLI